MTRPGNRSAAKAGIDPRSDALEAQTKGEILPFTSKSYAGLLSAYRSKQNTQIMCVAEPRCTMDTIHFVLSMFSLVFFSEGRRRGGGGGGEGLLYRQILIYLQTGSEPHLMKYWLRLSSSLILFLFSFICTVYFVMKSIPTPKLTSSV